MIHTNRIVTVGEQESIIDRPIVLYRGDREVEIEFTLVGNEFTFSEEGNVIKSVNASHGQLVLNTPSGEHMFSELAECHEGKVVFVVTKEMIDEFIEMGFYSFQIRLYDSAEMKSRVTIPPVMNGFDIRNPIAAEDETNVVDQGIVDYARIFKDQSNEELPTFDWTGAYNKTEWVHHDVITENKLNKIEDALYSINANVKESDVVMLNALDNVKKDADKYVKEHMAEVEADVEEFERNLNTDVQQFKIDTNAAMTAHKNEVSEVIDGFDARLADNGNKIKGLINVKDFGAKGDGVTDDTTAIQQALNLDTGGFKWVYIPDGTYLINQVSKIKLQSNTRLEFSSDAKFIAKEMNYNIYSMLDVVNVENIEIINPTLIGDRNYNNQTTEGAGHGISCRGVKNLKIIGAKCSECFTDGIYLNGITNGLVEYFTCDHNRRQGISITGCDRLVLRHGVCSNTDGTAPKMGIDIEPNFATDNIKGLVLENIQTITNATSGIGINLSHLQNNNDVDITLLNCIDTGSNQGLSFANYSGIVNENSIIYVQNYKSYNAKACGINICGWKYEGSPRIVLDSPTVIHPNMNKGTHERLQNVGISINGDVSTWVADTPQGRVDIIRPTIIAAADNPLVRGIYAGYNGPLKSTRIIDPLKIDIGDVDTISRNNNRSPVSFILKAGWEDVEITDTYNALSLDASVSAALIRNYSLGVFSSVYAHDVYSCELKDFVCWGIVKEVTAVFKRLTQYGTITLPTNMVFYYDGNILEGSKLQCLNAGSVKIKRLTNDTFNIEKIYGTWTVL